MNGNTIAKALFLVPVVIAAGFVAMWIAGFLFFALSKANPIGQTDLWTWWTFWKAYGDDPAISKRLLAAAGLAVVIVIGAIVAGVLGAKKRRTLYGEARFANSAEIARAGLFGSEGIIIGKWRNKFLLFGGMQFVLLAAPTRSGKGVGIVIPNLLNWAGSVVVLDIKQENFMVTSGFRRRYGQSCYLFNPFDKDGITHRYNPLGYVSENPRHQVMDLLAIATALYPGQGKDSFFDEAARNLFLGIGLLVFETKGLPRTIGEMLRQSSGKGRPVKEYLQGIIEARNFRQTSDLLLDDVGDDEEAVIEVLRDELQMPRVDAELLLQDLPATVARGLKPSDAADLAQMLEAAGAVVAQNPVLAPVTEWDGEGEPPLSAECVDALSRFLGTSDNTLSSIMASFNVPLTLWASPVFDAATSANDFDLRDVRRRKMSIYLGIPPNKLAEAELILNLFFTQLINLNTEVLLGSQPDLKHQCLLLMDEFTAPGRIAVIDKANAYMAGYGLRLLTIIQSPGQLEAEPRRGYGREGARTLITNHACQILYTPREQTDANQYSEMLGTETFKTKSRSNQLGRAGGSESFSDQKRPLMLPQELREMPQDRQIINLENTKPISCDKIAYFKDKVFLDRLREVSPSLRAIGNRMPTRGELEAAWGSGEMAAPVPKLDLDLHQAIVQNRTRTAQVSDVEPVADLSRIALDLSTVAPIARDASLDSETVEGFVSKFFDSMWDAAGGRPSEGEDDGEAHSGDHEPDATGDDDADYDFEAETFETDLTAASAGSVGSVTADIDDRDDDLPAIDITALYEADYLDAPIDDAPDPGLEFDDIDAAWPADALDLSILDRPETPAGH